MGLGTTRPKLPKRLVIGQSRRVGARTVPVRNGLKQRMPREVPYPTHFGTAADGDRPRSAAIAQWDDLSYSETVGTMNAFLPTWTGCTAAVVMLRKRGPAISRTSTNRCF